MLLIEICNYAKKNFNNVNHKSNPMYRSALSQICIYIIPSSKVDFGLWEQNTGQLVEANTVIYHQVRYVHIFPSPKIVECPPLSYTTPKRFMPGISPTADPKQQPPSAPYRETNARLKAGGGAFSRVAGLSACGHALLQGGTGPWEW